MKDLPSHLLCLDWQTIILYKYIAPPKCHLLHAPSFYYYGNAWWHVRIQITELITQYFTACRTLNIKFNYVMNATTSLKKKRTEYEWDWRWFSYRLIGSWCELPPRRLQPLGSASPGDHMVGLRFAVISSHFQPPWQIPDESIHGTWTRSLPTVHGP